MAGDEGTRLPRLLRQRVPSLGLGEVRRRLPILAAILASYASLAVAIYLIVGLGRWSPTFALDVKTLVLVLGFFVVPSLIEELVWRWLLIPPECLGRIDSVSMTRVLASASVFTVAHPVAAWLFLPHARELFTNPSFLAIVFMLGIACGVSYVLSKSIWPPIMLHWVTVLAWKFLLGGPFILLGR